MEKSLIHSNELHFIGKKRIHQAVEKMVESLDLAAGSTTGFDLYAVVEAYFTDLEKRREINRLLHLDRDTCEED
ncbi:hypothetical protein [Bacteroides fluxus]|jgi:hypothetical protein|uniref:Uncharacterized protein n=1 Tax=Bacteroides fluxus YIT 12057 TaxID=763034 RepID=F3PRN8_9BACE|nr:hypothetical protein [Bacteroides fluxus]EGF58089.1 hypothetical protein HMPREF9446_01389 [Bacteroides fluxus YIT 12057]MDY3790398.1 hypothetical protein [Bacteroides fluxus]